MTDLDNAYPQKEEIQRIDISKDVKIRANELKNVFISKAKKGCDVTMLLEKYKVDIENIKNGKGEPRFYFHINLHPFFMDGWNYAIEGNYDVPKDQYKRHKEIIDLIETFEANNLNFPGNFYQDLSDWSINDIKEGAAFLVFFCWLKNDALKEIQETQTQENKPIFRIDKKYNPKLVFESFKKYLNVSENVFNYWFVDGKHNISKLNWIYDNTNIQQLRAFMNELCGYGIYPKEINAAFDLKKPVDSHNKVGKLHDELRQLFGKCKAT